MREEKDEDEERGAGAGFVSVSEEQFLAMVLSDSLHQTIVLESSFGVVPWAGGASVGGGDRHQLGAKEV